MMVGAMCTDLRLMRADGRRVSGRTLDFAADLGSTLQVVPRGQRWSAVPTDTAAPVLTWANTLGFVAMEDGGLPDSFCDGLNEAGLSVANLELPESRLPPEPPATGPRPALDFVHLNAWLLGTCATVDDVRAALDGTQLWNPRAGAPGGHALAGYDFSEHLAVHDASGRDLVVEFVAGRTTVHDNPVGVVANAPAYGEHLDNLRAVADPADLGDPAALLAAVPGDVSSRSRFLRAAALAHVPVPTADTRELVNQAFHSLDIVSVPRHLVAAGDHTRWWVVRDHDDPTYYARTYDSWTTHAHALAELDVARPGPRCSLPLPA
jgi:choloylglycine hydrolase